MTKIALRWRLRPFPRGRPAQDPLGGILATPGAVRWCFAARIAALAGAGVKRPAMTEIGRRITLRSGAQRASASPCRCARPMRMARWSIPVGPSNRAIENARHWVTDMVFPDAAYRLRTRNAPAGFVALKPMGHSFAGKAPARGSIRHDRKPNHGTKTIRSA